MIINTYIHVLFLFINESIDINFKNYIIARKNTHYVGSKDLSYLVPKYYEFNEVINFFMKPD